MRRATLLAFLTFVAAALLATYPLLRQPSRTIAGGLADPIILTTVLAWDADRLLHGLQGLWDLPILYPRHWTLAYSEHMLGVAIFTAPIQWMFGNAVLTYNVAYIGSYVLAGFGMFLLTRALWGRADAAVLAGLAYALTPYRLAQSDHLQVLMNGWMPIGLLGLHRYFASGSRCWLLVFAAAYLLTGLSNAYYLYFFLLPIVVVAGVELLRPRLPRRRILADLSIAGAGIAAALAPVMFVYVRLQQEMRFTRDPNLLPGHSARLADYFRVAAGTWNWGGLMANGNGERQLFHGFAVIIFAVAGVCTVASRNRDEGSADTRRRAVLAYGLIAALALWLSIGPGPWRPYGLLFRFVPGFNGMRVPARLASVMILGLAVLAGAGFTRLFDRLPRRRAALAAIAVGAAIVFEGQHGIAVQEVPGWRDNNWDRVAYAWLRNSPPGAALELDITGMDYIRKPTTLFQLHALEHRHPIVNGYSGWSTQLQELLGARRSPLHEPGHVAEVVRGLRRAGVRYVLLHEATFVEPEMARRIVGELQTADDQIAEAHEWPEPTIRQVDTEYFKTLRVPLLAGRIIVETDDAEGTPVVVINESARRRFFGALPPLGQQISLWGAGRTVVGVVGNERFHGLAEDSPPSVYLPRAQAPTSGGSLLVRTTAGDPAALAPAIRRVVADLDPSLPLFGVEPLSRTLSNSIGQRRFTMIVLGAFAAVALLLAVVGVHGVLTYTVTQRTREIGIRMALGADRSRVRSLILTQGGALVAGGLILGLIGAFAITRLLRALLYGVSPTDPGTFFGVAVLLAVVALIASYLPAARAARVDPAVSLRSE